MNIFRAATTGVPIFSSGFTMQYNGKEAETDES